MRYLDKPGKVAVRLVSAQRRSRSRGNAACGGGCALTWPRQSSSAASWSMFCPTGSTASGITACWPARPARPTLPGSAPWSASSSLNKSPPRNHRPRSPRLPCASHAPAVAAPCASSRSSAAGKYRCHVHLRGAGRMTRRLSDASQCHRLPPAEPARTGCACPSSTRQTAAMTPERAALSGSSNEFAPASGTMPTFSRTADAAVARSVCALSP